MSGAFVDLLRALALMAVVEGVVIALASSRLHDLLEQLSHIDPERVRWGGLALAVVGTVAYLWLNG
ncbi:MAG: DUF2065 family protein [Pseudomonadota bacterium]